MTWKLTAIGRVLVPEYKKIRQGDKDPSSALKGERDAYFEETESFVKTPVYDGDKLMSGNILEGPCIVEERLTTVVIPPTFKMRVGEYGDYITLR
jgi:N-methylhydantoinase A